MELSLAVPRVLGAAVDISGKNARKFHLSPNANGVLRRLGIDATEYGAVEAELVGFDLYFHGTWYSLTV